MITVGELTVGGIYFTVPCFAGPRFYTMRDDGSWRLGRDKFSSNGHPWWFPGGTMMTFLGVLPPSDHQEHHRFMFMLVDGTQCQVLTSSHKSQRIPIVHAVTHVERTNELLRDLNELQQEITKNLRN